MWSTMLSPRTTALRTKGRRLLCVLAVALFAPAAAGAQFTVQPVILGLAPADSVSSEAVAVRNEGKVPIQFHFRFADFDQTLDGDHVFQRFGTSAHSCKGRVTVVPEQATLLPGERQDLIVRMAPGTSTCWGVLFVEQRARNASGIMVGQQIAVKVYGTRRDLSVNGEIVSVGAARDSTGVRVDFQFRNEGEGPLRPFGAVEIRTPSGEVVARGAVDAYSVLPGHTRRVSLRLAQALARGRYLAVPIMDFGADFLAGGQATFMVP